MRATSNATVEELMARHVRGERDAFTPLYKRLYPNVMRYVLHLGRDTALAEDVAQVALLRLHTNRHRYLVGCPVQPWLFKIAKNLFIDELRRRKRSPSCMFLPDVERCPDLVAAPPSEPVDWLVSRLPEMYAEAIVLTTIQGHSHDEAAQMLNLTKDAVKLRVHRGYNVLRKMLAANTNARGQLIAPSGAS